MDVKASVGDEWVRKRQDERIRAKETKSRRGEVENCEEAWSLVT